jgi:hypothetical protein
MIGRLTILILAIAVVAGGLGSTPQKGPVKPNTPTEGRDLSNYKQSGRFGCGMTVKSDEYHTCLDSITRARDFIWEHWERKQRAYAIVRLSSVDAVSDSHIFIEPDDTGVWHIVWRIERVVCMGCAGDIDQVPDIRSLERVKSERSFDYAPAGSTVLVFRDKTGKQIERL